MNILLKTNGGMKGRGRKPDFVGEVGGVGEAEMESLIFL